MQSDLFDEKQRPDAPQMNNATLPAVGDPDQLEIERAVNIFKLHGLVK